MPVRSLIAADRETSAKKSKGDRGPHDLASQMTELRPRSTRRGRIGAEGTASELTAISANSPGVISALGGLFGVRPSAGSKLPPIPSRSPRFALRSSGSTRRIGGSSIPRAIMTAT